MCKQAADSVFPTDDRIELSAAGSLVEVDCEFVQRIVAILQRCGVVKLRPPCASLYRADLSTLLGTRQPLTLQHPRDRRHWSSNADAQQQVLQG